MHTIAFSQSQDEAGVLSFVTPVPDPSVRVQANDLIVPDTVNDVIGAMACIGTTGVQAQLHSPSLRRTQPYDIRPVNLLLVPTSYNPAYLHEQSPITLDVNEALNCKVLADPAAAEQQTVVVFLTDKAPTPKFGTIIKCRFTVTLALVAGQWVNAAITFPDALPVGNYSCVGASLVAATAVVARFYPVGGKWRPGFPVMQTLADKPDEKFRNGILGEWFQFSEVQPPTIDIMSSAAAGSTTYTGVMDLIAL
jgi:hypothetical protein